jgi:sulfatase maturation enzyme AslB (radical SAM superfamily)
LAIIQKARNFFDTITVNFTGGEPLLRRSVIPEVLHRIEPYADGITNVTMTTNGTLLDETVASDLSFAPIPIGVDITIDGVPELHNAIRRSASEPIDSYALAVRGIRAALNHDLQVTVNSVITRHQVASGAGEYYKHMSSLGVPWIPGKVITSNEDLRISEDQFMDFVTELLEFWAHDDRASLENRNTLIDSLILLVSEENHSPNSDRCARAILSFAGDAGLVWPCTKLIPYEEFCLGSFLNESPSKIMDNSIRHQIIDLFYKHRTCAYEALIETGGIRPLPHIAEVRQEFMSLLRKALE